jgi:hypothetical protein
VTGPEHYQEAERLLAGVDDPGDPEQGIGPCHYDPDLMSARRAHAHATLALAAATAMDKGLPQDYVRRTGATKAWHEAGAW